MENHSYDGKWVKVSNVGKWVKVVHHLFITDFVGFITGYDQAKNKFHVILTKDSQGRPAYDTEDFLLGAHHLEMLSDENNDDDLLSMIDLALETKDKQWFLELTSQLPVKEGRF